MRPIIQVQPLAPEVFLPSPLRTLLERRSLRREIRQALESGVGLYQTAWPIDRPEGLAVEWSLLLAGWCRRTFARTRRPYGLDHITLSAAILEANGREVAAARFGVLRPGDFYGDGQAEGEIAAVIRGWREAGLLEPGAGRQVVGLILSWGDLTRELLAS